MRIQASAGRNKFLSDDYCHSLKLTADGPLDAELLGRLRLELAIGNSGYLLGQIRKWQAKDKGIKIPKAASKGGMP
jgi:hypothetical protein